jgi:hypothetical protein
MRSTGIRKQDSDGTIVRKLIRREVVRQVTEATGTSPRSANLVQNYAFGSGGGSFGSGGGSTNSGINADAYSNGSVATVNRGKLKATGGTYLEDSPNDDSIVIRTEAVNDPMFWLF